MGKDKDLETSIESKNDNKIRVPLNHLSSSVNQVYHKADRSSAKQTTTNGTAMITNQKKRRTERSQAQIIAAVITKRNSKRNTVTSSIKLKPGRHVASKHHNQTVRKLAGKLVKRTLNSSKVTQAGSLPVTSRYRKRKALHGFGKRDATDTRMAFQVNGPVKNEDSQKHGKKRRRRKKKTQADRPQHDDISRIKNRVKYLLNKIKVDQNLIDAYSAEGWKGQSREKIRPERELQRARNQIIQSQLGIREAIKQLDFLGLEGSFEASLLDAQGRIFHEDIYCARCKLQDAAVDNDIVLCDGFCNRAFHQLCLEPPLKTEDIPPGDEGWLCAVCECKLECLEVVNAYLGTCYQLEDQWQKIFAEAAALANGEVVATVEEFPSEDSEDDDYNPDQDGNRETEQNREASADTDASDSSGGKDTDSDLSGEDSEVSHFDEAAVLSEGGLVTLDEPKQKNHSEHDFEDEDVMLMQGKRQRTEVDYLKLHDEMFGKSNSTDEASEDEEWGPRRQRKKSKQEEPVLRKTDTRDGKCVEEASKGLSSAEQTTRERRVRLPPSAVEKLRAVFKENPFPTKTCKESLSKQLGVSFKKVNFWFRNTRYAAMKNGLMQQSKKRQRHSASGNFGLGLSKSAGETSAASKGNGPLSCYLVLLEMLNGVQSKVERLKKVLEGSTETYESGQVTYVPVAELREKL